MCECNCGGQSNHYSCGSPGWALKDAGVLNRDVLVIKWCVALNGVEMIEEEGPGLVFLYIPIGEDRCWMTCKNNVQPSFRIRDLSTAQELPCSSVEPILHRVILRSCCRDTAEDSVALCLGLGQL